jgi:hypothetical protein
MRTVTVRETIIAINLLMLIYRKVLQKQGPFQHSCHNPNNMQLLTNCLALTVLAFIFPQAIYISNDKGMVTLSSVWNKTC